MESDSECLPLKHEDAHKPYYHSPEELRSLEVDHIDAVSALGTNAVENLQLLCRLCNWGKGDGLGVEVRAEAQYAGCAIRNVGMRHRAAMLYYTIERDAGMCGLCSSSSNELTVRPLLDSGCFVRSNLHAVCVECADWTALG